jgi:hypothetical protein
MRAARTAWRRFPARVLHLVDIENLAGTGAPAEWQVAGLRRAYAARVGIGPLDQVVIGCSHKALPATWPGWPGARYLVRSGPDGADIELLAVLAGEDVAARFPHVAIASGDGIFTLAAAGLAAAGCQVTVVSRSAALATALRLAAGRVIYLDTPATAPTPSAPARPEAA